VLPQIEEKLRAGVRPDHITVGGSGEPTLNSALGDIIAGVKKLTDIPVALLTNGALLFDPVVRVACAKADVVLPDLDAGDEETFRTINRPTEGLTLQRIVQGLEAFRKEFSGQMWLEVFLVAGGNDSEEQVRKIARLAARFRLDKIQLNTAVRPPAVETVQRVSPERLEQLCGFFTPRAEVVADFSKPAEKESGGDEDRRRAAEDDVLSMLRRRPCTVKDIAGGLGISERLAAAAAERLAQQGRAHPVMRGSETYFAADVGMDTSS
jgi:wyosine [tRNA(Phe)-imidazoG37] synthetase (radical SAM superfamily)